jgi:hypothetical protein
MTHVGDPRYYEWQIGIIKTDLIFINLDTLGMQTDVLIERSLIDGQLEDDHKAFDKKARAAKSEIKKQRKAVDKVELCEELLSAVAEDSDTAKYLKKKIARICARRAKK